MKTTNDLEKQFTEDIMIRYGIDANVIVQDNGSFLVSVTNEKAASKLFNLYSKGFETILEKHPKKEKYFLTMK